MFKSDSKRTNRYSLSVAVRAIAISTLAIVLTACEKSPYSQKTPEDVIRTASLMVKNGDVKQLPNLIYAENNDMRAVLNRLGSLCGNAGALAIDLQARFPAEVAKLKADAQQAAAEGKPSSLLGQFMNQSGGNAAQTRRRRPQDTNPGEIKAQQDEFQQGLVRVFTDPFSMLEEAEGKLSVTPIDNTTVAVLYDDKPVFFPIGMTMKKSTDGRWYLVLPTNLPVAGEYMPRNHEEYSIVGSLIRALDNAVIDLRKDVVAGNLKDIDEVSRRAGEKAFVPAVGIFFAYSRAIEAREKAAKTDATKPAPAQSPASAPKLVQPPKK